MDSQQLRVMRIECVTSDVKSFLLQGDVKAPLPPFSAGAHIDVLMTPALRRSYSLVNGEWENDRYVIAVRRQPKEGGANYMHDHVSEGGLLEVSHPRNAFPLDPTAPLSILVAGGIGITPILSMARSLHAHGRRFHLYYCCSSRQQAAFLPELMAVCDPILWIKDEHGGQRAQLDEWLRDAPGDTHFYCCGPAGMLTDFRKVTQERPPRQIHTESFDGVELRQGTERPIRLKLARSGREIVVKQDETVLRALQRAGVRVPFSCKSGHCGTCEIGVISGIPDHRDTVLSDVERSSGKVMMACCSRALTDELILDL
jgi:vanillate O-demethylase ferredoxin subunit